ncbi:MAG: branched-chain amino acid ABC transporter permease [Alphaproteobacteria bacterium]|nr:branched-chain amino acid ABC transporter permease [Alphaproteobacteria bacterium]
MFNALGISSQAFFGLLLLGGISGAFYATMSLGLALIFGVLNIINFAHGAQYMMGAFVAWLLLHYAGIGYWPALVLAPVFVGATGYVIERTLLRRLYDLDHLYGLLLTFALSLIIEGIFRGQFGVSGQPYEIPDSLQGAVNIGFMYLPLYRVWVLVSSILLCAGTWWTVERTRLGAYLRAATENPTLVRSFGISVPRMITLTYTGGVMLAAFAGVLAAPIYQVSSIMGSSIIPVVFAVVVIGGLGSILGSIVTGFIVGFLEAMTRLIYPQASNTVVYLLMVIVLLMRPQGLFGKRNY